MRSKQTARRSRDCSNGRICPIMLRIKASSWSRRTYTTSVTASSRCSFRQSTGVRSRSLRKRSSSSSVGSSRLKATATCPCRCSRKLCRGSSLRTTARSCGAPPASLRPSWLFYGLSQLWSRLLARTTRPGESLRRSQKRRYCSIVPSTSSSPSSRRRSSEMTIRYTAST